MPLASSALDALTAFTAEANVNALHSYDQQRLARFVIRCHLTDSFPTPPELEQHVPHAELRDTVRQWLDLGQELLRVYDAELTEEPRPAAQAILDVFAARGATAGTFIGYTDFGDALTWQNGSITSDDQRGGLTDLIERGLVSEHSAGLELTEKGVRRLTHP